jgi:hypothetical protein
MGKIEDEEISSTPCAIIRSCFTLTFPDHVRVARNPSMIDAKRGDHCLQGPFSG